MANQSEKRALQLYKWYQKTYGMIVAGVFAWFFLIRIVYHWESMTFINWVGFLIFCVLNYFGLKFLFHYLKDGHPRSSYSLLEEFLWVVWFIMFLSVFTGYAWLLFLAIPGYFFYAYKDTIMSFFNARSQQQQQQQQMMEQQMAAQQQQYGKRR